MISLIEKCAKAPASFKASVAFAFSAFFIKGINFIATPVFTRIMDQTQYGLIASYNSWVSIIEVFAVLGLTSAGVFNSGLNEYKHERAKYIFSVLLLGNLATLITFAIIFISNYLVPEFILPINLLYLMLLHFLFWPAQIFWLTRERYEYRYKVATLVTIGSALLGQVFAIVAVLNVASKQGTYKLWANELGSLFFCIPIYFYLLYNGWNRDNKARWKGILNFSLPLIPHYLAQHVMAGASMIMLANMSSKADAGIFSVVTSISMISIFFWNAVNASLIPYTYEKINQGEYSALNSIIKMLLLGYAVICLTVVLIAPEVLHFLAPPEYYRGIYSVPAIAVVSFLNALYNLYANVEFYYKQSNSIATATIVASLSNIVLNFILILNMSVVGAAYATLLSNLILLFMHYRGYRKATNVRMYDDKFIALLTMTVLVCSLSCTGLYISNVLRYFVIAIILVAAIIKKEKLCEKFQYIRFSIKK